MKKFSPKGARLKKQQQFTHLTQGEVSMYTQEFTKLKRFVPSLVDIEQKMEEKFVVGLDSEIRCMVLTIDPKTDEEPLRIVKIVEKPRDEVRQEPTIIVWRKRPYDFSHSAYRPPVCRPRYAK